MTVPPDEDGSERARLRKVLAIGVAGAVANALWLAISVSGADLLGALLSGIGLGACAVPAVLCARRLAGRGPGR